VASYKSFNFLILFGSSNKDTDNGGGGDPNINVFLLLNTRNMCIKVYSSSADTIRLFVSTVDTFSLSSRIISVLIHLIYSWSSFHCQVISFLKITSLLIMTFFVMRLYNLNSIFLSPYPTKMHFSFLSSCLVILASGSLHKPHKKKTWRWVPLGLWPLHCFSRETTYRLLVGHWQ